MRLGTHGRPTQLRVFVSAARLSFRVANSTGEIGRTYCKRNNQIEFSQLLPALTVDCLHWISIFCTGDLSLKATLSAEAGPLSRLGTTGTVA
jgi:hypothetical protein